MTTADTSNKPVRIRGNAFNTFLNLLRTIIQLCFLVVSILIYLRLDKLYKEVEFSSDRMYSVSVDRTSWGSNGLPVAVLNSNYGPVNVNIVSQNRALDVDVQS